MNILIRNLPRETTEDELFKLFEEFGDINSCNIVIDEETGKSKGFGFVDMPIVKEGKFAIKRLNNLKLKDERLRVKITKARPKKE